MHNLLFITGALNYTNGVTSHLFNLISELKKQKGLNIILLCTGGDSIQRFKDLNIEIIEDINFEHGSRSVKNFSIAIKRLRKIIIKNNIEIVHSHNHYAANISYYASRFTGIKTVQTNHGLIPEGGFLKHFKAHKIIALNEQIENYLVKNNHVKKENVTLINHGYRWNGDIRKSRKEIKVLCASRLVYDKGVDIFIRAAKTVRQHYKGRVQFIVAGEGEYESELKKIAQEIDVEINFPGKVNDLPALLSGTNIFVMPSRSESEGFPMTIVEAALTKNFIITSEFKMFTNILKDKADGSTFEVNNYEQLAEKILSALNDLEKTELIAENFLNKARLVFDPETMARKHIEIYKGV